ncbi:M20/M25/M40 family metallo-hydrolase [Paenibacillus agricola]|uniref:M20/M25/M40 family metallo-hydrolase n=1 Tax=Paenibacillus agricola TaxID=2716264 RepID=A0ABX0JCW7_9BACL|nr:M20/M25/M40 family metallo-hydrolase [Paenibacillus agricola]NHN34310.1 M20/M25/M40 family metallo-hydrolase [Paenibacillus agricola]
MKQLKKTLLELLNIQGVSGREDKVAAYVTQRLTGRDFTIEHDHFGNVLAQKHFGATSHGPVLLLSAHMDTVVSFVPGRRIVWEDNDILRSSEGILGADDRAGIAILLEVIERMDRLSFNGTLKIAFTRDEERGRIGSNEIAVEQMRNMELLAEALRRRGFSFRYLGNQLILQPGSGKGELYLIKGLLNALQIEASYREGMVILEKIHFTEDLAELVSLYKAYNQESRCPTHMRSWKTFVKRRHGYNGQNA